jgi:hypothetical protein
VRRCSTLLARAPTPVFRRQPLGFTYLSPPLHCNFMQQAPALAALSQSHACPRPRAAACKLEGAAGTLRSVAPPPLLWGLAVRLWRLRLLPVPPLPCHPARRGPCRIYTFAAVAAAFARPFPPFSPHPACAPCRQNALPPLASRAAHPCKHSPFRPLRSVYLKPPPTFFVQRNLSPVCCPGPHAFSALNPLGSNR